LPYLQVQQSMMAPPNGAETKLAKTQILTVNRSRHSSQTLKIS